MNIAILCVLIGAIQPIIWSLAAKIGANKQGIRYDNEAPRPLMQSYDGWIGRANWAQQNAFEAFPVFAAAVILAMVTEVDPATINLWAIVWVIARFVFGFLYIFNFDKLRSLVWAIAMAASIRLLIAAI